MPHILQKNHCTKYIEVSTIYKRCKVKNLKNYLSETKKINYML